jgi:DNA-binding transcriptional LysR family regulator
MTMDWDLLRYFMLVARLGSLTKAAEQLKTTQATVCRRIDMLESELGVALFSRSPQGYSLTQEGHDFLPKAQSIEDQMLDLQRSQSQPKSDQNLNGTVRLATAENLATTILLPSLGVLRAQHPDLKLELATGVRSVSMTRREADLSLRLVRPTQNSMTIRKLGTQAHAVYASKGYVKTHCLSRDLRDLRHADLVGWDDEFANLQMAQWLHKATDGKPLSLTTTSLLPQIIALRSGLGVAVLPCFLGDVQPELCRVVEPDEVFAQDIWLTFDAALSKVPRIRVVVDWVIDAVQANANLLSGKIQ